jgi:hypothetical protein
MHPIILQLQDEVSRMEEAVSSTVSSIEWEYVNEADKVRILQRLGRLTEVVKASIVPRDITVQ